tara:strand:+ start:153 stop:395 length:243 start_codon:yes stop_codon:yes gene_type:complete
MAEVNEVYRIYVGEGWKDVTVTSASGDVVDFIIGEVEDIDGVTVGDEESAVDLATVTNDMLYDKDGVVNPPGEEAPDPEA